MLSSQVSAHARRQALRLGMSSGDIQRMPGVFSPLSARLIETYGYEGVYVSGAVMANELGLPDIGLTTLTEVAARGAQVVRNTELPIILDADTGFGEPMNIARSVQLLEDAGVSGIHLEDQVNPKRCGHLDGKEVVSESEAVQRIVAAIQGRRDPSFAIIARTDIRSVADLRALIERAKALEGAGADAIFAEAVPSLAELESLRQEIDVPIVANMTEFGKSPLFTVAELEAVGINVVIFPVSLQRLSMAAMERGLSELAATGSMASVVEQMQTRARLYEVVDYASYSTFDERIYNFDIG